MDAAARHRTLQLLGIELRAKPRDGDGDGFFDPDGKGPAPDKTPLPRAGLGRLVQPLQRNPAKIQDPTRPTIVEHVSHWHADLTGMDGLVTAAATGLKPSRLLHHDSGVKTALATFNNGRPGVITAYLGTPDRDPEDQADADQLTSALARAIGIPAPRVLRMEDDRTVSDVTDGPTGVDLGEDLRFGVLDLLSGVDSRDPDSVALTPGGVVPLRSETGFSDVDMPPPQVPTNPAPTPRTVPDRLARIAAAVDAAGPRGLSRSAIPMPAAARDDLILELLETGDYGLIPSSTGNLGHGARIVRLQGPRRDDLTPAPESTTVIAAPEDPDGLAFWQDFAADGQWIDNPLTQADIAWLRQRLDAVRPQFDHLGRPHWWQFAAARLNALAQHAHGTVNLFASA